MLILLPLILFFVQLQVLLVVNSPSQLSGQITCIKNPSKYLFESVAKNDFRSS